jgi:hypothetical protein
MDDETGNRGFSLKGQDLKTRFKVQGFRFKENPGF